MLVNCTKKENEIENITPINSIVHLGESVSSWLKLSSVSPHVRSNNSVNVFNRVSQRYHAVPKTLSCLLGMKEPMWIHPRIHELYTVKLLLLSHVLVVIPDQAVSTALFATYGKFIVQILHKLHLQYIACSKVMEAELDTHWSLTAFHNIWRKTWPTRSHPSTSNNSFYTPLVSFTDARGTVCYLWETQQAFE